MEKEVLTKLIDTAIKQRSYSYVPYSHFSVGAALLTEDGEIVPGSNVENLSYPAGLCAERTAIFSAVAKGKQKFTAIAVSGGNKDEEPADFCLPCGMCLQVMSEFCPPEFEIYIVKNREEVKLYHLQDLLPHVFDSLK